MATIQKTTSDVQVLLLSFPFTLTSPLPHTSYSFTIFRFPYSNSTLFSYQASGVFNETDGTTVLNAIRTLEPKILQAINNTVAAKPGTDQLMVTSLAAFDLQSLSTSTQELGAAFLNAAPVSDKFFLISDRQVE